MKREGDGCNEPSCYSCEISVICEKLNAAVSSNFYPHFLSELAPKLNTKVFPKFIIENLTKFQLKRTCIAGDNRKLQKLCFLKKQKTRVGVNEFFD